MTFEGFDAAMPLQTVDFPPAAGLTVPAGEPTLDLALRQLGAAETDAEGPVLRPLTPDELALIAGGNNSDMNGEGGGDGSNVTVIGPSGWDWNFGNSGGGDTYPSGSGSPGGGEPEEEANPTPCVETSPAGISLQEINNKALAASKAIAERNDETYEYSSIIWSLNGTVGFTTPYTDRSDQTVNWLGGLSEVPTGAIIVGIVHNHPDDPYVDDTYPSGAGHQDGDDWFRYDQMVNGTINNGQPLARGITVDSNMLLYMYTNQDHKTRVYDNTDKNQTNPSCSLQ